MQRNLLTKTAIIFATLIVFIYGIFGIPQKWNGEGLKEAILEHIHLGLDLKGGTHLILQVKVNDAVNADSDVTIERLREALTKANIAFGEIYKPDPTNHPEQIAMKGVPPDAAGKIREVLDSPTYQEYENTSGPQNSFLLTLKLPRLNEIKQQAVTQSVETIRQRVDTLGVSEPVIEEHGLGQYQILVQLPGVDDPARVIDLLQSTAMLEIRQALNPTAYPSEAAALQALGGNLPPNGVLLHGSNIGGREGTDQVYLISRSSVVAGRDIRDAEPATGETGAPIVNFFLTNDGGERFKAFTGAHVGDSLAVVLDNRVREVARIDSEIADRGEIKGGFTQQSAKDLGLLLRSGALPAGITILEERTVGPSLGIDSIRQGITAAVVGMAVVMLFMLVYYRFAGVNADLALIMNLVILLGFLGFTKASLSLPGIAGVILTIGMGVDSNVLIFERIREELRNGKSPAAAVDQGFSKAWRTIIDTHVTTIVSALILMFATGPVRGFAITLLFGLLANLFTSVFVSRVIFDAGLERKQRGEALSI